MRQILVVKVTAVDLAAIKSGEPLVIERADGGATISVEYERGYERGAAPPPHASSNNAAPPAERAPVPRGIADGAKKTKCPFCEHRTTSMKTHIYLHHPDKGLSATGPKCRFCPKRFPDANSTRRHEVRAHHKDYVKTKEAPNA
jgi:hypothetical protein